MKAWLSKYLDYPMSVVFILYSLFFIFVWLLGMIIGSVVRIVTFGRVKSVDTSCRREMALSTWLLIRSW
jgi:hypothetical protein